MTEQQGRDEIKPLSGSHVAPEKTEQLEETKKEIEKKVKGILKLNKDEGEEGNLNIESQLVDLVMVYYKQHDDHTAELKEKFHFQGGTSSSQYSDSDPSSKVKAEKASGSIKQKIEAAYDKGRKFFEDMQARDDQLRYENSTLLDGKEQGKIRALQLQLACLQTQKKDLEEQFEEQNFKLQLVQTELQDKILELERISKENEDNQSQLKFEGRKTPSMIKNIELTCKIASLQEALKKSTEEHEQIQDESYENYLTRLGLKDAMLDSCIEMAKKLKEEIIIRSEAIEKLQDDINMTESNLQISNNNLNAAEQLLAEKVKIHRKEEEKFQQEYKELKEQNSKLSNEIETAQLDLNEIRSSLEKTRNPFSELEVVLHEFQENDSSFQSRIVEVSDALWTVKNLLTDTNGKIEELEKRLNVKEDEALKVEEEKN